MGNISRHTGINVGGLGSLSWVFREDVSGFTLIDSTLYCQVTLKAGKSWNTLYGTPETIQMESEQQDTPSGMKYIYRVKTLVPKDRASVETEVFRLTNRWLILKVEDKNAVVRILGTMEIPMKLSCKLMKPPALEGFNGYELTFSGEFPSPARFLIPPSGIPDGGDID